MAGSLQTGDRRVRPRLGLRHGTPLASRDVPGERGRLSSCIWNLGFFPNDARKNCPFVQLGLEERDRIAEMRALGQTMGEIAEALGRSKATVSRELKRNATPAYRVYLPHRAHERAVQRKREAGERPRLKNDEVVSYVMAKLAEDWSPELIAGRIGHELPSESISRSEEHT